MRVLPLIAAVSAALSVSVPAFAQSDAPVNDTQTQWAQPAATPRADQPATDAAAPAPGSTSSQETYGAPHSSFGSGARYSDDDHSNAAAVDVPAGYTSGSGMTAPERVTRADVHRGARQASHDHDYPPAEFGSSGASGPNDFNSINRNSTNPGP